MNILGIAGSLIEAPSQTALFKNIQKNLSDPIEFNLIDIEGIPLFSREKYWEDADKLVQINELISRADAVILSVAECNRTIEPALKSALEWLSYQIHPLRDKPVMLIGSSSDFYGTAYAQPIIRQILAAPGVGAHVFSGHEFLLGHAVQAFDEQGILIETKTSDFLVACLQDFLAFSQASISAKEGKRSAQPIVLKENEEHPITEEDSEWLKPYIIENSSETLSIVQTDTDAGASERDDHVIVPDDLTTDADSGASIS
ncbi:NADPH-dependent oxidoreductase [Streptococcus sp. X16XC17]|uniref:NADPH-dependent FMN reductase n=1 Tax=unclassified Streptococcus TaxID=2608887 RepID=UPI00066FF99B|nr:MULTISPECIES: NAD(P)H-dependent oxidoreductase [unclassified Streptococcus]TCD46216.1 NADPH-dependent oxidoreductase [Streptococcus sp. X16XC17]